MSASTCQASHPCAALLWVCSIDVPPQSWLHFSTVRAIPLWYDYLAVPQSDFLAFRPVVNSSYWVQLGENRIVGETPTQTFSSVKRVILHPNYNSSTFLADIALEGLEKPIVFMASISPVCLLDASVHVPAGDTCWVTGWGNVHPEGEADL